MKHYRLPASWAGPRRGSENHSPISDDASHASVNTDELVTSIPRRESHSLRPHITRMKSEDLFKWKEQLKFRAFKGKRRSESKDSSGDIHIIHTTHDGLPRSATVHDINRPNTEESRASISRKGSGVSLKEQDLRRALQDDFGEPRGARASFKGLRDLEEPAHTENEDPDPWHLEEGTSAATEITTNTMDLHVRHHPAGNTTLSRTSDSTVDSDASSLQSFPGGMDLHPDDSSDTGSMVGAEGSLDDSPHADAYHNSWNWAEPVQQPSALSPAPPLRPRTVSRPTSIATATVTPMKANMVSLRRPSRPDNPWSWKLPAPDPSAPKINTVTVRRPSQSHGSKATTSPSLFKSNPFTSRRSRQSDDGDELSPLTQNFPRRPSKLDEHGSRPSLPPSPLCRDPRLPSRADEALGSHPVRVRHNSTSEPLCRMCHSGLAEAWGVCQKCEEELTPVSSSPKSHSQPTGETWHRLARKGSCPHPIQTLHTRARNFSSASVASWSSSVASSVNTPTTGTISASMNTPMTGSLHTPCIRLPPPAQPVILETEMTERSPPISPTSRPMLTEIAIPPAASSSLSGIPTSDLLARYRLGTEKTGESRGLRPKGDVYDDEWAAYYFDAENFGAAGKRLRTKSAVTHDQAQKYMARELALEEYDGFWGSPSSPGPGWI